MARDKCERSERLTTPKGRVSFPHLTKTEIYNGVDTEKYTVVLLFPKESTDMTKLKEAVSAVIAKAWPQGRKGLENPIKDGDVKESVDSYAGCWYIKCSTSRKPICLDLSGDTIQTDKDVEEKMYPGCWAWANVNALAWVGFGKLNFSLNGLKKAADDEPFGGEKPTNEDFPEAEYDNKNAPDTSKIKKESFDSMFAA